VKLNINMFLNLKLLKTFKKIEIKLRKQIFSKFTYCKNCKNYAG